MKNTSLLKLITTTAGLGLLATSAAYVYPDIETDASGNFLAPSSWSGDGAVTASYSPSAIGALITGTTGGTLGLGVAQAAGVTIINPFTVSMELGLNGGTADIGVGNATSSGTGSFGPNNFNISNISGTDSISVSFNFSEPIAATIPFLGNAAPYMAALNGGAVTNKDLSITYSGLVHSADGGTTFTSGLPATATAITTLTGTPAVSFPTGSAVGTASGTSFGSWTGTNSFDWDGGAFAVTEHQLTYATGITFQLDVTDVATNFDSSEIFNFSTNGEQYANITNIPEPTSGALLGLGVFGLLARRRR